MSRKKKRWSRAGRPYDYMADPTWNRAVVFGMMGDLNANYEAEEEDHGWVSLNRHDRRCMFYHPVTRRAYWTGFDPPVEFFIKDIEEYIFKKFMT